MSRLPFVTLAIIFVLAMACAASEAATDSGTGGSGGGDTNCKHPAGDALTVNGTILSNQDSAGAGQTCDPFVSGQWSALQGRTQLWAYTGWVAGEDSGGAWQHQVLLTFPAQAAGNYDNSIGATAEYTVDQSITCGATSVNITVVSYGAPGQPISGSYTAILNDAQLTGRCPELITGDFSVTRAQ